MKWDELNAVRDLYEQLDEAERELRTAQLQATLKVPTIDGLPRGRFTASRVEELAIRLTDCAEAVEHLKGDICQAQEELERKLADELPEGTLRTLLTLRYVDGMHFRDTAFALGYSEAHTYYLHRLALDKILDKS